MGALNMDDYAYGFTTEKWLGKTGAGRDLHRNLTQMDGIEATAERQKSETATAPPHEASFRKRRFPSLTRAA